MTTPTAEPGRAPLDAERARLDFPALEARVDGRPIVYLDSAATAQVPRAVLDTLARAHVEQRANVHRGAHALAGRATDAYEVARAAVQRWIGAAEPEEIVFTSGCTAAINLVAYAYGERLAPGDEIVVSALEHHSNLVPWQLLCERRGLRLCVAPLDATGQLDLARYAALLGPRTRLVAVAHVSNVLGSVLPVAEVTRLAHAVGARVLIDGAQAVSRLAVDVRALDCDFYAFSGHKLYGPFGVGVLYGKRALLESMPPAFGGGGMVEEVSLERASFAPPPLRFEAGTPNVSGAIGLGAAIEYLERFDKSSLERHDRALVRACEEALTAIGGVRCIGSAADKLGVCSFVVDGIHAHDLSTVLDRRGVLVRAGHHCAEPLMQHYGLAATVRASFGIYNTERDLERLVSAVREAKELFRR